MPSFWLTPKALCLARWVFWLHHSLHSVVCLCNNYHDSWICSQVFVWALLLFGIVSYFDLALSLFTRTKAPWGQGLLAGGLCTWQEPSRWKRESGPDCLGLNSRTGVSTCITSGRRGPRFSLCKVGLIIEPISVQGLNDSICKALKNIVLYNSLSHREREI